LEPEAPTTITRKAKTVVRPDGDPGPALVLPPGVQQELSRRETVKVAGLPSFPVLPATTPAKKLDEAIREAFAPAKPPPAPKPTAVETLTVETLRPAIPPVVVQPPTATEDGTIVRRERHAVRVWAQSQPEENIARDGLAEALQKGGIAGRWIVCQALPSEALT